MRDRGPCRVVLSSLPVQKKAQVRITRKSTAAGRIGEQGKLRVCSVQCRTAGCCLGMVETQREGERAGEEQASPHILSHAGGVKR